MHERASHFGIVIELVEVVAVGKEVREGQLECGASMMRYWTWRRMLGVEQTLEQEERVVRGMKGEQNVRKVVKQEVERRQMWVLRMKGLAGVGLAEGSPTGTGSV